MPRKSNSIDGAALEDPRASGRGPGTSRRGRSRPATGRRRRPRGRRSWASPTGDITAWVITAMPVARDARATARKTRSSCAESHGLSVPISPMIPGRIARPVGALLELAGPARRPATPTVRRSIERLGRVVGLAIPAAAHHEVEAGCLGEPAQPGRVAPDRLQGEVGEARPAELAEPGQLGQDQLVLAGQLPVVPAAGDLPQHAAGVLVGEREAERRGIDPPEHGLDEGRHAGDYRPAAPGPRAPGARRPPAHAPPRATPARRPRRRIVACGSDRAMIRPTAAVRPAAGRRTVQRGRRPPPAPGGGRTPCDDPTRQRHRRARRGRGAPRRASGRVLERQRHQHAARQGPGGQEDRHVDRPAVPAAVRRSRRTARTRASTSTSGPRSPSGSASRSSSRPRRGTPSPPARGAGAGTSASAR